MDLLLASSHRCHEFWSCNHGCRADYGDAGMAGVGHPLGPARVLPQAYAMASNLVGAVAVVTFAIMLFGAVPAARQGVAYAAAAASDRELASIHILRLLAIGTIIKYSSASAAALLGLGVLAGFPFCSASAIAVALWAGQGILSREFLIGWHTITLVFFAGISMFLSMPSPLRLYHAVPDASIVFRFPMILAPNFTVPLFMLAHVFALVKLIERGWTSLTCWADRRSSSAGPPSRQRGRRGWRTGSARAKGSRSRCIR